MREEPDMTPAQYQADRERRIEALAAANAGDVLLKRLETLEAANQESLTRRLRTLEGRVAVLERQLRDAAATTPPFAVANAVGSALGYEMDAIRSGSRKAPLLAVRRLLCALLRDAGGCSYPAICEVLRDGGVGHAGMLDSYRVGRFAMDRHPAERDALVRDFRAMLHGGEMPAGMVERAGVILEELRFAKTFHGRERCRRKKEAVPA